MARVFLYADALKGCGAVLRLAAQGNAQRAAGDPVACRDSNGRMSCSRGGSLRETFHPFESASIKLLDVLFGPQGFTH